MKKDQYIPHEVSTRSNSQVIKLIEAEGMEGYGIYWTILEYLRVQDNYIGDIQALASLKRQARIRQAKLDRILYNYGLFICDGDTFYSPKLNEVMKPLEDRRARIEAYKRNKEKANHLEINEEPLEKCDILSFEGKGKGKGKGKVKGKEDTSSPIPSSSFSAGEEVTAVVAEAEKNWEKFVDALQEDEQWMELVATRSGLKQHFHSLFPKIVEYFKRHVRSIGNEGHIHSLSDAKHYFFFFMNPSSATYKSLIEELNKPVDKGIYKYEDYPPGMGKRSYCGIPIPFDAPPRPNDQAVWIDEKRKWVY